MTRCVYYDLLPCGFWPYYDLLHCGR